MSDNELLKALKKRDPRGMDALVDRYGRYIYAIVARVAGSAAAPQDVEECVSDTLVGLWRNLSGFDPSRGELKNYIATAARRRGLNLRRDLTSAEEFFPWTRMS